MWKVCSDEEAFITTSPWMNHDKIDKSLLHKKIDEYRHLAIEKSYPKGSCLITAGDVPKGVYYIGNGSLQCNIMDKNGSEKILTIHQEDCFIGEEIMFHNQPALYNAYAVTDVKALIFPKNTMLKILHDDFMISYFIMYSMALRVRVLANQIGDVLFRSTMEKVVRVLYYYYFTQKRNNDFSITHNDGSVNYFV